MPRVDVKPAARFVVDGVSANVLENNLQNFPNLGRKRISRRVEATVLQGC